MATLTHKIIESHLVAGRTVPGEEIALKVDQTLIQDATGTMVWMQFDQLGVPRVRNDLSVTYVDHNILQTGPENPDDHLYLQSACARYGGVFSRPGNGISHFAHLERFNVPGMILLGSDSHTCTAGALCVLGIGAGGAEVAAAMAGEPFYVPMPEVLNVRLVGQMPPWVSAKDIILEVLRRISVKGGVNKVLEYTGPGVKTLSVYQRATIANMGQETGATGTVFPADQRAKQFLRSQGREADFRPIEADPDAQYHETVEIELSELEPLIARPYSPDNVVAVRAVAGTPVTQVCVGSSVNSGYTDLMMVAAILKGKHIAANLHMTMNPGSRQILLNMVEAGAVAELVLSGVRCLEVGCGPCIGMGASPPSGGISVRTFNRNFRGRSGTADDQIYLCSPETAAATALTGVITDPRDLGQAPVVAEPEFYHIHTADLIYPPEDGSNVPLRIAPSIKPPPEPDPPADELEGPVLIKTGDNISTDDILPAGNEILPLRSNIPRISEYTFRYVDPQFVSRAKAAGRGFIVGGENYGQGSSREHAAIAPMFLGVRAALAKSYARIHRSNLVDFAIVPLVFADAADYEHLEQGQALKLTGVRAAIAGETDTVACKSAGRTMLLRMELSTRERDILRAGGLTKLIRGKTSSCLRGPNPRPDKQQQRPGPKGRQ